jgi:putative peptidoglycan lipid II flippase
VINQEKYLTSILFVTFFCYSICMALVFQHIVVPQLSTMYGGGKLLSNDAVYFDKVAWQLAEDIRIYGWSHWQLYVNNAATANVSILATLYAVFGHDPSLILPINSSLHAIGGVLIFLLAREIALTKKTGIYAGLIAGAIFIVFPSALNWYGQLHKDGYAIAGTLLVLLMWIKVLKYPVSTREWLWLLVGTVTGITLIGIVRPYGLTLLLPVTVGAMLLTILTSIIQSQTKYILKQSSFFIIVLAVLITGTLQTKQIDLLAVDTSTSTLNDWQWQQSDLIPDRLETYLISVAKIRSDFIYYATIADARSGIDTDIRPHNISEFIIDLPRALHVAMMAPFPITWFSERSAVRLLASAEMFIYYLCLPGLLLLIRYNRQPAVWMATYFSTAFLTVLGFTIANLGTLYRVRYAYLLIILMLGVLGWITYLERKGLIGKIKLWLRPESDLLLEDIEPEINIKQQRKRAVGSVVYVAGLTFLGFIGFFYRDILMAQTFGLATELDSFFVALLVPMTIVTIICLPLGAAFTPYFLTALEKSNKEDVKKLITGLSAIVLAALVFVCVALNYFLPILLPHLISGAEIENLLKIRELIFLALPILLFSGPVIIGNAVLNALGQVVMTGIAQLVVPLLAIFAIVLYGEHYGVRAAMLGMVAGQLLNLFILQLQMNRSGYSLIPRYKNISLCSFESLPSLYFPLVASAFFVSMAILVSTILATSLPVGSVSIFNLGNKVVLLATGIVGAAISTVMLPYFSRLIAKKHMFAAQRELSAFLLLITFFSVPISVGLFVWSKQIIGLLFSGGSFVDTDVAMIASVMQYAVVQIPFFACNVLLLKFATATKHVRAIFWTAIAGLVINVAASMFFMNHMGVAGLALGASLSVIMATIFLIIILVRYGWIGGLDMIVLLINWLLFITLLISVHFGSVSGIVVTIFAYIALSAAYGRSLHKNTSLTLEAS